MPQYESYVFISANGKVMHESMLLKKKVSGSSGGFNPSMKGPDVVLSNNNFTANLNNQGSAVYGLVTQTRGKWYFEFHIDAFEQSGAAGPVIGIAEPTTGLSQIWKSSGKLVWYCTSSTSQIIYSNADIRATYGNRWTVGDVIGIAADLDAGNLQFTKNGVGQGVLALGNYVNPYSGPGTAFLPVACSPFGATGGQSGVTYVKTPQFLPAGYGTW